MTGYVLPQGFEYRVQLYVIIRFAKPERTPRIQIIACNTLCGAMHDVMIDDITPCRQIPVTDTDGHGISSSSYLWIVRRLQD
jgi:hypothetical protein